MKQPLSNSPYFCYSLSRLCGLLLKCFETFQSSCKISNLGDQTINLSVKEREGEENKQLYSLQAAYLLLVSLTKLNGDLQ